MDEFEKIETILDDVMCDYITKYTDWYNADLERSKNYNDPYYEEKRINWRMAEIKDELFNLIKAMKNF